MVKLRYHSAKRNVLGVAMVLLVSSFLVDQACSQEDAHIPSEWGNLSSTEGLNILDMLADQMKGNYEKIRTWDAEYQIQIEDLLSADQLSWGLDYEGEDAEEGLLQRIVCSMHILIDLESNAIYWYREDPELSWLKPGSRQVVEVPAAGVSAERSVFSGEDYLHFQPTNLLPKLKDLPEHPEAQNKRVAYKDPIEDVRMQQYRDLLDPRLFFGEGVANSYWDYLGQLKADAARLGDRLRVSQAEGPGGPWYRVSVSLRSGALATMTCSPTASFNPVKRVISSDESRGKVLKDVQWQWKQFGDIYLPAEVEVAEYRGEGPDPTQLLKVKLGKCVLNRPVDPQQFTYRALGLEDGDLVMDRVNNQFLICRNDELVKLANFGEKYVAPEAPFGLSPFVRVSLAAAGIVGLVVLVLLVRARRERTRTESSSG